MSVALVTGASRGIGAATARTLASLGYAVAVNYVGNRDKAEEVVADIVKAGGKAIAVQADMGIEADITRMFATIDRELGTLTALVNNAAINRTHSSGALEDMPWELVEAVYRVNVFGVFAACREAIVRMKKAGGGGIVNVSSEAGKYGGNRMTHYASSKAAINTMTIGLAREVGPHNIRVNTVSPGVIDTDAHSTATPERIAGLKASIPLGRMGTPDEVANVIAWLLSDESSYVSGAVLSVNGAR